MFILMSLPGEKPVYEDLDHSTIQDLVEFLSGDLPAEITVVYRGERYHFATVRDRSFFAKGIREAFKYS